MAPERPAHLPLPDALATPLVEFPPYPMGSTGLSALGQVSVSHVTAIAYACTPRWQIPGRSIADDMLFWVYAGGGEMSVDGRRHELRPGDIAHWRRAVPHSARTSASDPLQVVALHYTAMIDGTVPMSAAVDFPSRVRLSVDHPLARLIWECARAYTLRPAGWRSGCEALTTTILLGLLRESHTPVSASARDRHRVLTRLRPALEAMRDHLVHPLPVAGLAGRCALSEAHFRRLFVRAMGCSPVAHLRRLRLAEACRLLTRGELSIEAIAGAVGYAEPSCFARTFRTHMGMTPGTYRHHPAL